MVRTKHTSRFLALLLILSLLLTAGAAAADDGEENTRPDFSSFTDGLPIDSLQELLRSIDLEPIREKLASLGSAEFFEELKELLADTKELTDEELGEKIAAAAEAHDVTLNETQVSQLVRLCRHYESLSELELKEKFNEAVSGLDELEEFRETAGEWKEKASEAAERAEPVFRFLKNSLQKLGGFLTDLFEK